jgi:uncharacterized protein involved in exopolysaccharide biosynthesis
LIASDAPAPAADLVDLAQIGRMLARRWRVIAGLTLAGAAAAVAVLLWAPRRFEASSSLVVRSNSENGASLLSRLGVPAELAPSSISGSLKSPIETEVQILQSRSVLGAVSDSLGLQVRAISPRGVPPWQLVTPQQLRPAFRKVHYAFERSGAGWHVTGAGVDLTVARGQTFTTPVGTLTVSPSAPSADFEVEVLDREEGLRKLSERVAIGKPVGEVVTIAVSAPDSLSAAAVPNAMVAVYLQRRKTTDRGTNEHKAEFLAAQVDTTNRQLADAERSLRAFQERSGVVDPEVVGKVDLEGMSKVRELLAANEVEGRALEALLHDVETGAATPRQLAAYPSLLKSPAINEILTQIAQLETQRTNLLERRTLADPAMVQLSASISDLEKQLRPLGTAYATSLARQHASLAQQSARFDSTLATLPASAQSYLRLQRDVKRLSQASLALQAQLGDVRLAAVGEGGDVRRLDEAFPPDRVAFPRPLSTLAVGVAGGLFLGVVAALFGGFFSQRVEIPEDAERVTGLPAALVGRGSPRFFVALRPAVGLVVAPLDDRAAADAVAAWLGAPASRALPRAVRRTVPTPVPVLAEVPSNGGRLGGELEAYSDDAPPHVLPPMNDAASTFALEPGRRVILAARRGGTREQLAEAAAAVRLAGAEPVAVVLT